MDTQAANPEPAHPVDVMIADAETQSTELLVSTLRELRKLPNPELNAQTNIERMARAAISTVLEDRHGLEWTMRMDRDMGALDASWTDEKIAEFALECADLD